MARYADIDKFLHTVPVDTMGNTDYLTIEKTLIQATADVAPRAEVAREIFREIYAEIFEMLPLKVFRPINGDYVEKTFESGKESALHGVLNCIAELEKKYTEGRDG